jgi:hypothetical protein
MLREIELDCTWRLVKEEVGDNLTPGVPEHVVINGVFVVDGRGSVISNIIDALSQEELIDMAEEIYIQNYG